MSFVIPIDPANNRYFATNDPIESIIEFGVVMANQELFVGQRFMVLKESPDDAADLLFSSFQFIDDMGIKMLDSYTEREVTWFVNYTEQEKDNSVNNVNSFGFIFIEGIKHPDRDEYAIPYIPYVFDQIPAGPIKDAMALIIADKITNGHHKTTAEIQSEGWF